MQRLFFDYRVNSITSIFASSLPSHIKCYRSNTSLTEIWSQSSKVNYQSTILLEFFWKEGLLLFDIWQSFKALATPLSEHYTYLICFQYFLGLNATLLLFLANKNLKFCWVELDFHCQIFTLLHTITDPLELPNVQNLLFIQICSWLCPSCSRVISKHKIISI